MRMIDLVGLSTTQSSIEASSIAGKFWHFVQNAWQVRPGVLGLNV